ncbi:ankyrin repeat domain-containing protein [Paracoccus sp. IB05]|nr:ankyrin repeat domain-containing protein [Paracoccus sp. IB05]
MQWQVLRGDLGGTRWLLDRGADPNEHGRFGETAIHQAVMFRNTAMLELLPDHGGDPRPEAAFSPHPAAASRPENRSAGPQVQRYPHRSADHQPRQAPYPGSHILRAGFPDARQVPPPAPDRASPDQPSWRREAGRSGRMLKKKKPSGTCAWSFAFGRHPKGLARCRSGPQGGGA